MHESTLNEARAHLKVELDKALTSGGLKVICRLLRHKADSASSAPTRTYVLYRYEAGAMVAIKPWHGNSEKEYAAICRDQGYDKRRQLYKAQEGPQEFLYNLANLAYRNTKRSYVVVRTAQLLRTGEPGQ